MTYGEAKDVAYAGEFVAREGWTDRCLTAVPSWGGQELVLVVARRMVEWRPSHEDRAAKDWGPL